MCVCITLNSCLYECRQGLQAWFPFVYCVCFIRPVCLVRTRFPDIKGSGRAVLMRVSALLVFSGGRRMLSGWLCDTLQESERERFLKMRQYIHGELGHDSSGTTHHSAFYILFPSNSASNSIHTQAIHVIPR